MLSMLHRLLLIVQFLFLAQSCSADEKAALRVGITAAENKVFQSTPFDFSGNFESSVELNLVKNEIESFQLVLFPSVNLTNIEIRTIALKAAQGQSEIAVKQISIHPLGYVELVAGGKDKKARLDFHPDLLLPNQKLQLTAGKPQPVMIQVASEPGTPTGNYAGKIRVTKDQQTLASIDLKVTIHPVSIPQTRQFKTLSLARTNNFKQLWPEKRGYQRLDRNDRFRLFGRLNKLAVRNHLPTNAYTLNGLRSYNWKGQGDTRVILAFAG